MAEKINSISLKRAQKLTKIGLYLSALYSLLLVGMITLKWQDFSVLKLNELGDFVAGALGPLAMLWLVLGYLQQGNELKQNTDALRLQAEELANNVKQQKELVALGHAQLQREKELSDEERSRQISAARPKFVFSIPSDASESDGWISLKIDVQNVGAVCSHLRVYTDNKGLHTTLPPNSLHSQSWQITAQGPASEPFEVFDFFIAYLDVAGNIGRQLVSVSYYSDEDNYGYYVYGEDDQRLSEDRLKVRRQQRTII